MKNAIIFMMVFLLPLTASASRIEGKISFIQAGPGWTSDDAYFLVKMIDARTDKAECATDERLAINPTTNSGKVIVSMLLAAKAAGQTVEIIGSDDCAIMGREFESIRYVRVK